MTLNGDFKGDALDELCAQLTRDLFAIAKFLFNFWLAVSYVHHVKNGIMRVCCVLDLCAVL